MIGAVVLAAGAGRRMGGVAKALLPVTLAEAGPARNASGAEAASGSIHTTFLGAIVRVCAAAGVDPASIAIVVGAPHGAAVAREAARLALAGAIVWNDDPDRGMASSVAIGFGAIAKTSCHAALLWPVDHARVAASTIERLDDAFSDDCDAVIPLFENRGGHPALISRSIFAQMIECERHEDGARGVLRAARTIRVPTDDAGVIRDADVPEHLA